jgi:hypothetical protein
MIHHKKIKRIEEAKRLKSALTFLIALLGDTEGGFNKLNRFDPEKLNQEQIKSEILNLRHAIDERGKEVFERWHCFDFSEKVEWLFNKQKAWETSCKAIWEVGRVHEIEQAFGSLVFRRYMECPPYAQVIVQGLFGAAIRHPEYHLARDLALHMNLLLDSEIIIKRKEESKLNTCSEINQTLARSVILTCYNLLEAFINGLVAASAFEFPNITIQARNKLLIPDRKRSALRFRFEDVPAILTNNPDAILPYKSTVIDPLFSNHKWRRDSFVHCEPGAEPDRFGKVKEDLFHDTEIPIVRETVELTVKSIRIIWKLLYKCEGPRWLQNPDTDGRFPRIDVKLISKN